MSKTISIGRCIFCDKTFEVVDKRKKFCNNSCAAKYNNKGRKLKESSKKKISSSLKKHNRENPRFKEPKKEFFWNGIRTSKGRFVKNPKNIYELSKRTRSKIMDRMKTKCSRCDWNEEICDIHHIYGRDIDNCHNHNNLSILCPNCHRLAQRGLIPKEELINMDEQIGDEWKKHYYG